MSSWDQEENWIVSLNFSLYKTLELPDDQCQCTVRFNYEPNYNYLQTTNLHHKIKSLKCPEHNKHACAFWQNCPSQNHTNSQCWNLVPLNQAQNQFQGFQWIIVQTLISFQLQLFEEIEIHHKLIIENSQPGCSFSIELLNWKRKWMSNENGSTTINWIVLNQFKCCACFKRLASMSWNIKKLSV